MDTCLLLAVQQIANKQNFAIPWDEVGKVVDPLISKGAVVQHLAKLRLRKIANNEPVPPRLVRGGMMNPAGSSTRVNGNSGIKKTTPRKGASTRTTPVTVNNDDYEEADVDVDEASDSEEDFGKSRVKRRKVGNAEARMDVKKEDGEGEKQTSMSMSKHGKGNRASTSVVEEASKSANPKLSRRAPHVDYASIKGNSDDEERDLTAEQYVAKNAPFLKLTRSKSEASKAASKKGKDKGFVSVNDVTSRLSKMVTLNVGKSQKAAELAARIKGEENVVVGVEEPDTEMREVSDGGNEGDEGVQVSNASEIGYTGTEAATAQDNDYTYDVYGTDSYDAVNYSFFDEAFAASSGGAHTFDGAYMNTSTNHAGSHLDLEPSPAFSYQNIPGSFFNANEHTDWADNTETTGPWTYPYVSNAGANAPTTPLDNFQYRNSSIPSATNLQSRVPVPTTPVQRSSTTSMYSSTPQSGTAPVVPRFASSMATPPRFAAPMFTSAAFASSMDLGEDDSEQEYVSTFDDFFTNEEDEEGEIEVVAA